MDMIKKRQKETKALLRESIQLGSRAKEISEKISNGKAEKLRRKIEEAREKETSPK